MEFPPLGTYENVRSPFTSCPSITWTRTLGSGSPAGLVTVPEMIAPHGMASATSPID